MEVVETLLELVTRLCEEYQGIGPELITVRWVLMQILLNRPARLFPKPGSHEPKG